MAISNITGGSTGNQNLGGYSIRFGKIVQSSNLATDSIASGSHDGDFDGAKQMAINTGLYESRFDDYTE